MRRVIGRAVTLVGAVLALCLGVHADPVRAQDYPTKQITLLVPVAVGGALDITVRALAPILQRHIGQPVLVANRTGAAGAVGVQSVAVAAPDGYTVLVGTTFMSLIPAVDKVFGRAPAFSRDDFIPVALLSAEPVLFFVKSEEPWKTLAELGEDVKKKDGAIVFSSSGIYGPTHIPVEMWLKAKGLKMRHLPTTGGGPAMTAALGGNSQLVAAYPSVGGPHAKAGKLRALVATGAKRHPDFPDVPTFKELGFDIEYYPWIGLFFHKAVPEPIIKTFGEAVRKAVADPEYAQAMVRINSGIDYKDREAFTAFFKKDSERLEAVVNAIGKVE